MQPTPKENDNAKRQAKAQLESIKEFMSRLSTASEADDGTEDQVREDINADPLSIEVRAGWHMPGQGKAPDPEEFMILLCTGGPAVRIIGQLDEHMQPEKPVIQYQDWFTPWTDYHETTDEEDQALLEYCQCFYYGE